MKLLLDQNLSRKLIPPLAALWPETSHVCLHGLAAATDQEVWDFAMQNRYAILSKDNDFFYRALLQDTAPKIILLRMGNASTSAILDCLLAHRTLIDAFGANVGESVLVMP